MSEGHAEARGPIERWTAPAVEGPIVGRRADTDSANDAEQRSQTAWRANQARGYEAGVAAGRAEMQPRIAELDKHVARLDGILKFLAQPLEQLDAEVESQLTELALTIGKHLVRRELSIEPAQVIALIREAVARLPAAARDVRVHLHPEDAAVVRERLATPGTERAWSIVEDPALTRGGCQVRTDTSCVDARLETRLNSIVAALLGDERAQSRAASTPPESAA